MKAVLDIVAAAPDGFSQDERDLFNTLVKQAGEVGGDGLVTNIPNSKALVFGRIAGEVFGVAALKRPQASYRERIGRMARVDIGPAHYPYELGYVFLLPEARGKKLSHGLVAAALAHAEGAAVFATTRTDNAAMLSALAKAGFKQVGQDYPGRGTRMIRLLVRPQS